MGDVDTSDLTKEQERLLEEQRIVAEEVETKRREDEQARIEERDLMDRIMPSLLQKIDSYRGKSLEEFVAFQNDRRSIESCEKV